MQSTRKQIRIMNLGDVVTIDLMKTISALTTSIAAKKSDANINETASAVRSILPQVSPRIDAFKRGEMTEQQFNGEVIGMLKAATGIELSTEEFDTAWDAMHPEYKQFADLLSAAIAYNNEPNQQLAFISFTNPKDMRHLQTELEKNHIAFKADNNELTEIGGIKLSTTYRARQTKHALLASLVQQMQPASSLQSNSFFQTADMPEIKYVRGVNNLQDPILKEGLDQTNLAVEKQAQALLVDTIIWIKQEKTLSAILKDQQVSSRLIAAPKL